MAVFVDLCVHRDVIEALKNSGIKVVSGYDVGLESASDSRIFDYVFKNHLTLLTFDQDFGNILRFDIRNSRGVVIVYVEDMFKEEFIKRTLDLFQRFRTSQLKGRLFIVEKNRIRIWPK